MLQTIHKLYTNPTLQLERQRVKETKRLRVGESTVNGQRSIVNGQRSKRQREEETKRGRDKERKRLKDERTAFLKLFIHLFSSQQLDFQIV